MASFTLALAPSGASAAVPAVPDCSGSFNPYDYSETALAVCSGMRIFPRIAVTDLPGNGKAFWYSIGGSDIEYLVPPADFNADAATDSQIAEYGLPKKPVDAPDLAIWHERMQKYRAVQPPPFLVELSVTSGGTAKGGVTAGVSYNNIWAGYAATGSSNQFTEADMSYFEPAYGSTPCSGNAAVVWAGIGGYNGPYVGQDGTAVNVPGLQQHQAWSEIFPQQNIVPQPIVSGAGHTFGAEVDKISGGYHFFLQDYSESGNALSYNVGSSEYDGHVAEAVVERPSNNNVPYALSNFQTLNVIYSHGNSTGYDSYGSALALRMTNNGQPTGRLLALPGSVSSPGSFSPTWQNCS